MLESIAKIAEAVSKLAPIATWLLLTTAAVTAGMVWAPPGLASSLGVTEFRETYRLWIGLFFFFSCAGILTRLLLEGTARFRKFCREQKKVNVLKYHLKQLNPDEQKCLLPYIEEKVSTQYVGMENGIFNGLQAKGIVYRSTQVAVRGFIFGWNLQPWVQEYLRKHPRLLKDSSQSTYRSPRERTKGIIGAELLDP